MLYCITGLKVIRWYKGERQTNATQCKVENKEVTEDIGYSLQPHDPDSKKYIKNIQFFLKNAVGGHFSEVSIAWIQ